jgi:site-specific DNA-methyltransferase (cytosine-N4-specific)
VNKAQLLWHGYKYFPYERELARREVQAIIGTKAEEDETGLIVPLKSEHKKHVARLTYFKGIKIGSEVIVPDQARLEASVNSNGSAWRPNTEPMPTLRRQSTRYSAHGLHEYRGKFNPQVVRAIGNLLGLDTGLWVLDPFCGSGTTLLESAHIGWNSAGLDVNPLGILIANAKVTAFKTSPSVLESESERLITILEKGASSVPADWRKRLPNGEYLVSWFTEPVLAQLAFILGKIKEVKVQKLQDVFRVILSDICRDVSLQDPGDLRIRRRKDPEATYAVIPPFVDSLRAKISSVLQAREYLSPKKSKQKALLTDSRSSQVIQAFLAENRREVFDAAITSPPYATALPYIDTQRLSLCLLGLINSDQIRHTERSLIGNREISDAERVRLEASLIANDANLPSDVFAFCKRLLEMADHDEHGFRKRNVPALVFKYFWQMGEMFESVRKIVQKGGKYALLVGSNRTTLRGEEILINTSQFLASLAMSKGWAVEETLNFETYQRFDVHKKNSIVGEVLLILRNEKPC